MGRAYGNSGTRRKLPTRNKTLRPFELPYGLPSIEEIEAELDDMRDVLLGRAVPPIEKGEITLYEVADAYYARICDIIIGIQRAERCGDVTRGSPWNKFRTGELRTMAELTKSAATLGSRRITAERLRFDQELRGQESL